MIPAAPRKRKKTKATSVAPVMKGKIIGIERFKYVILDEVHLLTSPKHITGLMSLRPYRICGFTATKGERNNLTELFVGETVIPTKYVKKWKVCFPKIITDLNTGIVEEMVEESLVKHHENAVSSRLKHVEWLKRPEERRDEEEPKIIREMNGEEMERFKGMLRYGHSISILSSNANVLNFVLDVVNYYVSHNQRIIIITVRNEMTDVLYRLLHSDSEEGRRYVVEYLDGKKKECGNCDVLLGTHKKMGTGFDEQNSIIDFEGATANTLLFLGSIKDETLMYQLAGRVFRSDEPTVIFPMFSDIDFSIRHIEDIRDIIITKIKECVICEETASMLEQLSTHHSDEESETDGDE